jgi:hypothetical protein
MPVPVLAASASVLGDVLYVGGGVEDKRSADPQGSTSTWQYTVPADTWTTGACCLDEGTRGGTHTQAQRVASCGFGRPEHADFPEDGLHGRGRFGAILRGQLPGQAF